MFRALGKGLNLRAVKSDKSCADAGQKVVGEELGSRQTVKQGASDAALGQAGGTTDSAAYHKFSAAGPDAIARAARGQDCVNDREELTFASGRDGAITEGRGGKNTMYRMMTISRVAVLDLG